LSNKKEKIKYLDGIDEAIQDWRLLPETINDQILSNKKEKIKYLDGIDEEFVKSATLISMCDTLVLL
jgi:hypothetical protein